MFLGASLLKELHHVRYKVTYKLSPVRHLHFIIIFSHQLLAMFCQVLFFSVGHQYRAI